MVDIDHRRRVLDTSAALSGPSLQVEQGERLRIRGNHAVRSSFGAQSEQRTQPQTTPTQQTPVPSHASTRSQFLRTHHHRSVQQAILEADSRPTDWGSRTTCRCYAEQEERTATAKFTSSSNGRIKRLCPIDNVATGVNR